MQDATGATWSYSYDLLGEILTMIDPAGEITLWLYVGAIGQVTGKVDVTGQSWLYGYDAAGRMTSQTDPVGNVTQFAYDAQGRVVSQTVDPGAAPHLNLTSTYEYDAAGRRVKEIVDPGSAPHLNLVTQLTYDAAGRLTGKQQPNGGVWTFGYDLAGNQTTVTDPLTHTTTNTFDAANRLVLVTDHLGNRVKYGYDVDDRRTTVTVDPATDPNGNPYPGSHLNLTTTTVYDNADRVTSVTDPSGLVTQYGYDAAGNRTSVTVDPGAAPHLNLTTSYEFDQLDRLWRITDPLGRTTTYTFDSRGRKTQEIRGASGGSPGITIAYTYDDLGRVLSETVDPGTAPHLNLKTEYTYDGAGRKTSEKNPLGRVTSFTYDAAGRLKTITDAANPAGVVTFGYDAAGRRTSVTNPNGKTSTTTYDALGNPLTETDPVGEVQTHVYNAGGLRTRTTDARGVVVNYVYDNANRLTNVQDATNANLVTYGWDAAGRRTGMTDATGSTSWLFDGAGRVTQAASPQGTLSSTYDAAGRRATMTLPGSRTVGYAYDVGGQLTGVTDWQSRTTTFGYTSFGAVASVARPNGVGSAYGYDAAGRLTSVEHARSGSVLARFGYTLDANGNRTGVAVTGSALTNGTETYTYDVLDRLTQATYVGGGTANYTYDKNGNRTSVASGGQTTTYAFDDADRLVSLSGATTASYTYDDNGNRLTTTSGGVTDVYQYDWKNRLTSATVNGTTATYAYAGDDRRATRTQGGTTTPYLWDRVAGLPEVVDDGTTAYVQLNDPGLVAEVAAGGAATYPLPDGLGSARARTDGAGAVVGTADWDAYGNARGSTGTQGSFGWAGELGDPTTGMTHLRARDYAPGIGRFTSRDTVSPNAPGTQGYNPYAYAANNPTTFADPTGHITDPRAVGDLGGTIMLLVRSVLTLADVVKNLGQYPPAVVGLIVILVALGLYVLRTLLVMTLLTVGIITIAGIGGHIGTAMFLLGFARMYSTMRPFFERCAADRKECGRLGFWFPEWPLVPDVCALGVCDWLRGLGRRDIISLVGICATGSAAWYLEGATTYCEVKNKHGTYAIAWSWSVMIGNTHGGSVSVGALVGFGYDNVHGLGGSSLSGDFTGTAGTGADLNVQANSTSFAVTFSYAGGLEGGISVGFSRAFGVWEIQYPFLFGPPLAILAAIAWGDRPA